MSKINRLREIFKIDWINTIRFNFNYFPFATAIVFPVFLYRTKIIALKGSVVLTEKARPGMIKLGKQMVPINQDAVGFVYENRGGNLYIGSGEIGSGGAISIQEGAVLTIGSHFHSTSRGKFICAKEIKIGNYLRAGWESMIMDTDWHSTYNLETKRYSTKSKRIEIGDCVWLASNVQVMKGAKIPNFSIVAGRSLFNRKFEEPYSLFAGSPAELVKSGLIRDEFLPILELCKSK